MRIETAACSYQGGRPYNEDTVRCHNDGALCAAVVADGLGGHGGGQIASEIAANYVIDSFLKDPKIKPEFIKKLFIEANTEVIKAQTKSLQMKTTAVALFLKNNTAVWGHAGDSRLYQFKNKKLIFQTTDHSVSQMAVFSGEITRDDIRHHIDRNKITKALGADKDFKPEISGVYGIDGEFYAFLLCTDGFWEYVLEENMEIELSKSATPDNWLKSMAQLIEKDAPKDNDNYSAAAVFINKGEG